MFFWYSIMFYVLKKILLCKELGQEQKRGRNNTLYLNSFYTFQMPTKFVSNFYSHFTDEELASNVLKLTEDST